ncbi:MULTISPECIES: hypothetical protein [Rhodococcus]|uniref:DUF7257 domain-containing protein n=1 Tax=Rhodococcus TaxID=1827 RepID=UPI002954458B|nr:MULTISPECIES: hypothetical protein [Rhodococcus]MDV7244472.1 hypothetical protein [Rhodococcus oxybenzonivorans]MDV7274285.1 hypothetical protein [Rhodococcus oxybenzonivorans]MDV7337829.1 hypothetical protein [Rhodococcus oxybenzonivorans]MDV7345235.1 hypothetical protein [Rhodococcus oxybenzonivorans]MDV8028923.1 hypothetical protein [Rhodococcus sp. IEGM 27]
MTSPDNFVPGGPNTGWDDVGDLADALGTEGILGLLFGGFANLGSFLDGLKGAVTGTNPGTGAFTDIFDHLLGMETVGIENASAIAAINAALGGENGTGVYFVDTFDRPNTTTLGTDWTVVDPAGTGLGIENNQAVVGQAAPGSVWAACNTLALGNDMSVAVVVGSLLEAAGHELGLHVRMNAEQTAWVYLNVFKNKVYLGRATRSGGSITFNDWVSVTSGITVANGTQVEIRATGSTYRAFVGGKQVAAYTDATVSHPVGASNRSTGFRVEYDDNIFVGGRSPALGSFAMADITVPETLGTGWNLYRNATGSSTGTSWTSSGTAFGSNTFDVEDRKANVIVDNLGLGRIKTTKAGWYTVTVHATTNTATANASVGLLGGTDPGAMAMIKVGQVGPDTDSYESGTSIVARNFGASWVVYCPANYYLQPCGWKQSSSNSMSLVGNPAGYNTNFSGALMG